MPIAMMLSRGIRRVPLDYQHPKGQRYDFRLMRYVEELRPTCDAFYVPTVRAWLAGREAWQKGEHPDQQGDDAPTCSFEEWTGNGPDPGYYYPGESWPKDAAMGICMYESVTEGTPISAVYPDTPEGRLAMAEQIVSEDTSVTASMTVDDWLRVIDGEVLARDIRTGELT